MLRILNENDADQLRILRMEALQIDPIVFVSLYEFELNKGPTWYKRYLTDNVVIGAFVDDRLCGISSLIQSPFKKQRHRATCSFTYVTPSHRRRGLSRMIKEFVFVQAKRMEIRQCISGILTTNIAMRELNKSMGCEETHIERGAICHDGVYYDLVNSIKYIP